MVQDMDAKKIISDQLDKAEALIEQQVEKAQAVAAQHFGKDNLLHLAMGSAVIVAVLLVMAIAKYDIGFALAVATTLTGAAYEAQQKFRGEGEVSMLDAAATAAPGFLAWGALALFGLR